MHKIYNKPEAEVICFEESIKGKIQTSPGGFNIIDEGNPDEAESDDFHNLWP